MLLKHFYDAFIHSNAESLRRGNNTVLIQWIHLPLDLFAEFIRQHNKQHTSQGCIKLRKARQTYIHAPFMLSLGYCMFRRMLSFLYFKKLTKSIWRSVFDVSKIKDGEREGEREMERERHFAERLGKHNCVHAFKLYFVLVMMSILMLII